MKRAVQLALHSCPKLRRLLVKVGGDGKEGTLRDAEAVEERYWPVAVRTVVMGAAGMVAETGAEAMK